MFSVNPLRTNNHKGKQWHLFMLFFSNYSRNHSCVPCHWSSLWKQAWLSFLNNCPQMIWIFIQFHSNCNNMGTFYRYLIDVNIYCTFFPINAVVFEDLKYSFCHSYGDKRSIMQLNSLQRVVLCRAAFPNTRTRQTDLCHIASNHTCRTVLVCSKKQDLLRFCAVHFNVLYCNAVCSSA